MSITYDMVKGILDEITAFIPNPEEKAKARAAAEAQLIQIVAQNDQAQTAVNQVEAASTNLFVSGWRPFIGWVCGFSYAWNHLFISLLSWVVAVSGYTVPTLPTLVDDNTVLLGLLGLGTLRTVEKIKGVL